MPVGSIQKMISDVNGRMRTLRKGRELPVIRVTRMAGGVRLDDLGVEARTVLRLFVSLAFLWRSEKLSVGDVARGDFGIIIGESVKD
jgi:hypothetical protein